MWLASSAKVTPPARALRRAVRAARSTRSASMSLSSVWVIGLRGLRRLGMAVIACLRLAASMRAAAVIFKRGMETNAPASGASVPENAITIELGEAASRPADTGDGGDQTKPLLELAG